MSLVGGCASVEVGGAVVAAWMCGDPSSCCVLCCRWNQQYSNYPGPVSVDVDVGSVCVFVCDVCRARS